MIDGEFGSMLSSLFAVTSTPRYALEFWQQPNLPRVAASLKIISSMKSGKCLDLTQMNVQPGS